jgi:hypothetical protein
MFAVPTAPGEIRHPSDIPGGDPNRWVSLDLEKSDAVALFEWLSVLTVRDCRLSPNEGGYVAVSNLISELERVVVAPSSVGVANGQPTLIAGSPPSD